ncbi:S8 family serine peptidase [uncultured Shewanella sp.]|uniref:S8 family serine peptidase n=1 Tax=uncultured Shewanella sp. TaxID=173975 RepID=UPI002614C76C|nr:S8 family serine peptidase [uncultured Shewanella sp.]
MFKYKNALLYLFFIFHLFFIVAAFANNDTNIGEPVVVSPPFGEVSSNNIITISGSVPENTQVEVEFGDYWSQVFIDDMSNRVPINDYTVVVEPDGSWSFKIMFLREGTIAMWLYTVLPDGDESYGIPHDVVYDAQPPLITLVGGKTTEVLLGNDYVDPGVTTDDGSSVSIDASRVNTHIAGTYEVFYDTNDIAGNSMTTHRIVNVVDPINPKVETSCYGYGNSKSTLCKNGLSVRVDKAWDRGYTGDGYMVAIIDKPLDALHPFFAGKQVVKNNNDTCAVNDNLCSHGTQVAGVAAGRGADVNDDDVVDFSGIAKDADILGIDSLSTNRLDDIYDTYRFEHNIAAVNMSFGILLDASYYAEDGSCDAHPSAASVYTVVQNLRDVGIAVIAASGNDGVNGRLIYPACVSNVISVASAGSDGSVSDFANIAASLDFVVPTNSMTSNPHYYDRVYQGFSGTSAASPLLAGAWLILKQHSPDASIEQIHQALKQSSTEIYSTHSHHRGYYNLNTGNYIPRLALSTINLDNALTALDELEPLYCDKPMSDYDNVIEGTAADDNLVGASGSNLMLGYGGNDILTGNNGHDCIYGGEGDDVIKGNRGNDHLYGEAGADILMGKQGDDKLYGGDGNDILQGNKGDDLLYGGSGDDGLEGRAGTDTLYGDSGSDSLNGGGGNHQDDGDLCENDPLDSSVIYCSLMPSTRTQAPALMRVEEALYYQQLPLVGAPLIE